MMGKLLHVPPNIDTLGEAIYWARQQRQMTLRQLARTVGVSAPFMSDVEHGRRRPSDLKPIADALDVSQLDLARLRSRMTVKEWEKKNPELADFLKTMRAQPRHCHCPWCRVWR